MDSRKPTKTPPPLPKRDYYNPSGATGLGHSGSSSGKHLEVPKVNDSSRNGYQNQTSQSHKKRNHPSQYGYSEGMFQYHENNPYQNFANGKPHFNPMFLKNSQSNADTRYLEDPRPSLPSSPPKKSSFLLKSRFLRTRKRRMLCLGFSVVFIAFATFYGIRFSQATTLFQDNASFRGLSIKGLCSNIFEFSTQIEIENGIGDIELAASVSAITTEDGTIALLNTDPAIISVGRKNLTISGTVTINSTNFQAFQSTIRKWLLGSSVNVTINFDASVVFTSSWFLFPLAVGQQLPLTTVLTSPFGSADDGISEPGDEPSQNNSSLLYSVTVGEYDPLASIKVLFGLSLPSSSLGAIVLELPPLFFDIYIDDVLTGSGESSSYILGIDELLNATVAFSDDDVLGTNQAVKALLVDYKPQVGFKLNFTNQLVGTPDYCFIRDVLDGAIVDINLTLFETTEETNEEPVPVDPPPPLFGLISLLITNFGNLFIGGKTFVGMRLELDFTGLMSFFRFEGSIPALDLDIELNTTGPNQWKTVGTLQTPPFQLRQSGSRSATLDVILEIEDGKAQNFIDFLFALPGTTKPFIKSHPLPLDLVGRLTESATLAICACINTYIL